MNISKYKLFASLTALLLITSVMVTYWPAIDSALHLDDVDTIINSRIAYMPFFEILKEYPTRWLVFLTFKLNTSIHSIDNLVGFHLINLMIHILNAFLFFLLTRTICLHVKIQKTSAANFLRANWTAFFCSLIFALHPLQSQCVIYITQRFMLLSATFYLISLLAIAQAYLPGKSKKVGYTVALLSLLAGAFCKEIIVTAPILAFIMILLFSDSSSIRTIIKQNKLKFILITCAILAFPVIIFGQLGRWDLKLIAQAFQSVGGPISAHTDNLSHYTYLMTQPAVILNYAKLFVYPIGLNIDHNFLLSNHWYAARTVLPVFFSILAFMLAWKLRKLSPFILWGLLFFVITLLPQSSFVPTPDLMFEHRAYLGTGGLCWVLVGIATLVYLVLRSHKYTLMIVALASLLILTCSVLTFKRAEVWQTEFSLWRDAFTKSPQKQRVVINYCNALLELGATDTVIYLVENNKKVRQQHLPALYSLLGNTYAQKGQTDLAISNYIVAIKHEVVSLDVRYNLAALYFSKGDYAKALHHCRRIHYYKPEYPDAYMLEGYILITAASNISEKVPVKTAQARQTKYREEARIAFQRYLDLDPKGEYREQVKAELEALKTRATF